MHYLRGYFKNISKGQSTNSLLLDMGYINYLWMQRKGSIRKQIILEAFVVIEPKTSYIVDQY